MTGIDLLEKYPHSAKAIQAWFLEKLLNSLKDESVDDNLRDYMRKKGVEMDKVGEIIELNPHSLFEIFDENDIIIEISHHPNTGFTWRIEDDFKDGFDSRPKAERAAMEEAIKLLDEKLKNNEKDK